MKFAEEDTFKMTDVRTDPNRVFRHAEASRRPVLVVNKSEKDIRKVAVVQAFKDFETADKERAFMRALIEGLLDVEKGHEVLLAEAKSRLGVE